MFAPSIVVVDVDSGTPLAEIQAYVAAQEKQLLEHFGPLWGVIATIRAATPEHPPREDEWRMELRRVPTIDGALGFHDQTDAGNPILYVFPELCAQDGTSWTSCASHEILEALADPLLNRCYQSPIDGSINAGEVCDAVETKIYKVDGVELSDFVTPQYFSPPKNLAGVKLDWLGAVTSPYQILDGGYGQTYDATKGWTQLGPSPKRAYRVFVDQLGLSRGARR